MLCAKNISKTHSLDNGKVDILNGVNFELSKGEFVAITGRSGSGKTTLLNVLSTLVRPDAGELSYGEADLMSASAPYLDKLRKSDFAVIFQFHHLLPYLTVLENTLLPFMNSLKPVRKKTMIMAKDCLARVGLADKANRLPGNLSGGEQQRVAIARALVKSSKILFADEPTGSLDKKTGEQIMDLMSNLHREGLSIVMVTHDPSYAQLAERRVHIEDGMIVH